MNDQPMLRTYSPDAFDWLKGYAVLKDTNRRYDSNRERCYLEEIYAAEAR